MRARSWLSWGAMAVVLVTALAIGTFDDDGPRTAADRSAALAASIRCPTCKSQSALDSDAPAARAIRTEIGRRVAAGETDAQIRAYLVSRYGEQALLRPRGSGLSGLVWALPVVALVVALAGLVAAFARWRSQFAVVQR